MFTVGCGSDSGTSLTSPSSSIPNVTGNYAGATTMTFPELGRSLTCPTTTSVTQSGATVNIAPLILSGSCANLSLPLGQARIDATGAIDFGGGAGTYTDPSCGTYSYAGSGGFFGRDLRISLSATSRTCFNFNMTVSVTH